MLKQSRIEFTIMEGRGTRQARNSAAWLLSGCLAAFTLLYCQTTETGKKEAPRDMAKEEQLAAIRNTYQPIACFQTSFRINVSMQGRNQTANGSLRVDNGRQRMLFIFTDTIFGITISRVSIQDGIAYVYNPHAPQATQRQTIPVDRFAVSGLGSNSIALPFRLFQDLLYARIPPDVFAPGADLKRVAAGQIVVALDSPHETYRYGFTENRLRELVYLRKDSGDEVRVALEGTYGESAFPQSIAMDMVPKVGRRDSMGISFRDLNLKARCEDAYFPKW